MQHITKKKTLPQRDVRRLKVPVRKTAKRDVRRLKNTGVGAATTSGMTTAQRKAMSGGGLMPTTKTPIQLQMGSGRAKTTRSAPKVRKTKVSSAPSLTTRTKGSSVGAMNLHSGWGSSLPKSARTSTPSPRRVKAKKKRSFFPKGKSLQHYRDKK